MEKIFRLFWVLFLFLIALTLMLWSGWHMAFGHSGYFKMKDLEYRIELSAQQISFMQKDYDALYHRISLLKQDPPDLDLLEERVRNVLHYAAEEDFVLELEDDELEVINLN